MQPWVGCRLAAAHVKAYGLSMQPWSLHSQDHAWAIWRSAVGHMCGRLWHELLWKLVMCVFWSDLRIWPQNHPVANSATTSAIQQVSPYKHTFSYMRARMHQEWPYALVGMPNVVRATQVASLYTHTHICVCVHVSLCTYMTYCKMCVCMYMYVCT